MLTQTKDASFFNRVLNHPAVRPDVADLGEGVLDVSAIVAKDSSILLTGEHGGCILYRYYEGCYEVHTAVLPSGRGRWAKELAEAVLHFMFTQTDCIEVITRVPQGHIAAKALTEAVGFHHHFTTLPECLFRSEKVPCHVYLLILMDWAMRAPGLEERGAQFHAWLNKQVTKGIPHDEDPAHNRVVGCALDMMMAGQIKKALIWYDRWALAARHPMISLVGENPPQVRFDAGILTFAEDGIRFTHAN
jgi:hypothetical protein